MRTGTIREYARELLLRVSFVDVFGRNVGYDYQYILSLIKKAFPRSNTTPRLLWWEAAELRSEGIRIPARRTSRRVAARDYTRALLMVSESTGYGLSNSAIRNKVRARFPEVRALSLIQVRSYMVRAGLKPPPRPPRKGRS